jgi:hypothetical protein
METATRMFACEVRRLLDCSQVLLAKKPQFWQLLPYIICFVRVVEKQNVIATKEGKKEGRVKIPQAPSWERSRCRRGLPSYMLQRPSYWNHIPQWRLTMRRKRWKTSAKKSVSSLQSRYGIGKRLTAANIIIPSSQPKAFAIHTLT